jgi:hypothetical protein
MSKDFSGSFDNLTDNEKNIAMVLAATYHFRDASKNHDGSMGTIRITPLQLRDLVSYCMIEGQHSMEGVG